MLREFFSNHQLFAGLLGLLQVAVLPGWLLLRWTRGVTGLLVAPLLLALSLVVHFQCVLVATALGVFSVETLAALLLAGCGLCWVAARSAQSVPTSDADAAAAGHASPLHRLALWLAAAAWLALTGLLLRHIPGVFDTWDAVVSWNRWANDWARGQFPTDTYGYPQLLPAAWATSYVWLGTPEIQFFAKGLMALFPLGIAAIFADMALRLRCTAAALALTLWCVALWRVFPDLIDSGYADVPVVFFVTLTAYLLWLGRQRQLAPDRALLLASVTAAAAVLTKQSGLLALVLLSAALFERSAGSLGRAVGSATLRLCALWLALSLLPWYASKLLQLALGSDPSNLSYVTSTIFGSETLPQRFWRATSVTLVAALQTLGPMPWVALALFGLALAALRSTAGRWCWIALVLPYYLVWSLFYSYDLRNFMPVVPFLCLGLGLGLQQWLLLLPWRSPLRPMLPPGTWLRFKPGRLLASAVVLLLAGSLVLDSGNRQQWLALDQRLRGQLEDPLLNQKLLEYVQTQPMPGRVLTTYTPAMSIPALRQHMFFDTRNPSLPASFLLALKQSAPLCQALSYLPRHQEIAYLLLHTGIYPELIGRALAQGRLALIFQSAGVRFFRLQCSSKAL